MSYYDEPPDENWNDDSWLPEVPDDSYSLIRDIAEQFGVADFEDIVIDLEAADPANVRGVRFSTLEEAVIFLFQIGVLSFSNVVLIDDLYGVQVPPESPVIEVA